MSTTTTYYYILRLGGQEDAFFSLIPAHLDRRRRSFTSCARRQAEIMLYSTASTDHTQVAPFQSTVHKGGKGNQRGTTHGRTDNHTKPSPSSTPPFHSFQSSHARFQKLATATTTTTAAAAAAPSLRSSLFLFPALLPVPAHVPSSCSTCAPCSSSPPPPPP